MTARVVPHGLLFAEVLKKAERPFLEPFYWSNGYLMTDPGEEGQRNGRAIGRANGERRVSSSYVQFVGIRLSVGGQEPAAGRLIDYSDVGEITDSGSFADLHNTAFFRFYARGRIVGGKMLRGVRTDGTAVGGLWTDFYYSFYLSNLANDWLDSVHGLYTWDGKKIDAVEVSRALREKTVRHGSERSGRTYWA